MNTQYYLIARDSHTDDSPWLQGPYKTVSRAKAAAVNDFKLRPGGSFAVIGIRLDGTLIDYTSALIPDLSVLRWE